MRASPVCLSLVVLSSVSGMFACGPAESPPPATPVTTTASATAAPPKIAEDRTPVDAPAGLVMQGHAIALRAIARSARAYLPASAPPLDPRKIVSSFGDGSLDRIVDVDKPADIAMILPENPKPGKPAMPNIAFAFGVEDSADVIGATKGSYRIEARPGGVLELIPNGATAGQCVVAPSIGVAKYRLICAVEGSVMPVVPWLARGVTRNPEPTTPIHVEVDVVRIRKTYGTEIERGRAIARGEIASEIKTGFPEIDRVLKGWAKTAVDEAFDLIEDLDRLSLDVAMPNEGVQPTLGFAFGGTKSWSAKVMLAGGDATGTPSKTLGKLPNDNAWLAGWSRATPQSDSLAAPFQTALKDFVDAAASEFKWPAKDRDLALDIVKNLFPAAADTAFVSGNLGRVDLPENAPKAYGFGRTLAEAFLSKTYSVSVVERDAKAPIALAKAFGAWIVRPSIAETYRKLTKDRMTVKISVKQVANKDLPKGSFAQRYELELGVLPVDDPSKKGPKPKVEWINKLSSESLIVPEGATRSYVGFGQNLAEGELWKKVQAGMAGGSPAMSTAPGFAFITEGNPVTGMLMTVDGTARNFDRKGKFTNSIMPKLPDGGHSALAWRVSASKPPKATAEVTAHIPRDAISAAYLAFMK